MRQHLALAMALFAVTSTVCQSTFAEAYSFSAEYTADWLHNISGGVGIGSRYLDNLDVILEINVAEAWNFGNGSLFLYGLYNNGTTFSDELVGDLQVVSNIDTGEAWRLYEFWYEFGADNWSMRFGLYDLNSEFDVKETGAVFLNSSHGIGADISQSGENGPGIFPISAFAIRTQVVVGRATIRMAVLDGVPGNPDNLASNAVDLGGRDGVLGIGELNLQAPESTRIWAGYWRYSSVFEHRSQVRRSNGNDGWYAGIEQLLQAGGRDISWYLRYGHADTRFNPTGSFLGGGVVVKGISNGRPHDELGFGVTTAMGGDRYDELLATQGGRTRAHETILEITYRVPINERLVLQPDIQFVDNPSFSPEIDDAWVIGLRMQLAY